MMTTNDLHQIMSKLGHENYMFDVCEPGTLKISTPENPTPEQIMTLQSMVAAPFKVEWNKQSANVNFIPVKVEVAKTNCPHNRRYKNIVSANLKFWSCSDCGADLGDIND